MSAPAGVKYYQPGVIVPVEELSEDNQWTKDPRIFRDGMIFIRSLLNQKVVCVQSRGTGEMLVNKTYNAGPWPGRIPLELRISTAPDLSHRRLPEPIVVDGVERITFIELVAWQRIQDRQNAVYSLYFRFYNGGTLENLINRYFERRIPIPEHFVWHVAERLALAIRFFHFGAPPGSNREQENWEFIAHRDMVINNIFLHYHPRRSGRQPRAGQETNAFPEIAVGDFGESNLANDDENWISNGIFSDGIVHDWEDMAPLEPLSPSTAKVANLYFMGESLRKMVQTHIPYDEHESDLDRPNRRPMRTVNNFIPAPYAPYSDELIELLANFEFPGSDNGSLIDETVQDDDGNDRPLSDFLPTPEWVVDTMLPLARRKVRRYRGIGNKPAGYYTALDVSWTRPKKFMPYEYIIPPFVQVEDDADEVPNSNLHSYQRWNHIDPEFTTFWFRDPAMYELPTEPPNGPYPPPPPGGDSDVESTPDDDSNDDNNDDDDDDGSTEPDEDTSGNYLPGRRFDW
ncbi:hypothetical protein F5Y00DRAFT_258497 [Daldinia vernicosa]|uniref:uncharacterized protein n=1 Tax=Daldinia vernicosa TaxID=114800 RepID=UPI002007CE32|nr:uncharacterized protein F5Y00DRAFT_258497 [Daldinia vernicosa]KAI0852647.1 hypothetical protein F5Y00DRAFT_258497 [Daldinia vernicosa]